MNECGRRGPYERVAFFLEWYFSINGMRWSSSNDSDIYHDGYKRDKEKYSLKENIWVCI